MQADERLGATSLGDGRCHFCVWAPLAQRVEIVFAERSVPMERGDRGYHRATVEGIAPGARYRYRLDGEKERPDPASRFQPEGVHGPSAVTDPGAFRWSDADWAGLPMERFVIYELHIGTFTPAGTFDAAIAHLDTLKALGVTAIEIMPVAQYPGDRGWGYDGVQLYAVQNSYGSPEGLMRLVDGCHARGLAVLLDVVYNHFGPEGNYLWDYAPYFTERYTTPWGAAVNFDGPQSDEVRRFFLGNALQWLEDFHFDGLRLDAIDAIKDGSASTARSPPRDGGSLSAPRITIRSATVRRATASATSSRMKARNWHPRRCCSRRSCHSSSWARSTANCTPSSTSRATAMQR
ncbi:MAG: hypothetical protein LC748_10485 [Thermomicrobia bacterium]|nr:hypothetical protein [Thermomicrobia bacterium]